MLSLLPGNCSDKFQCGLKKKIRSIWTGVVLTLLISTVYKDNLAYSSVNQSVGSAVI